MKQRTVIKFKVAIKLSQSSRFETRGGAIQIFKATFISEQLIRRIPFPSNSPAFKLAFQNSPLKFHFSIGNLP